jgi:predicted nucleic acid-binding protein
VRILLDANLLIRAAITPSGAAREIPRLIETNEAHVLVISMHLLAEVADVLRRDRIRERWPISSFYILLQVRWGKTVAQASACDSRPYARGLVRTPWRSGLRFQPRR